MAIIRSSVNLNCFISVSLQVTDSTHFWRKFRGSGHHLCSRFNFYRLHQAQRANAVALDIRADSVIDAGQLPHSAQLGESAGRSTISLAHSALTKLFGDGS